MSITEENRDEHDVIIIGGGLAGLVTAIRLADRSVSIKVIDKVDRNKGDNSNHTAVHTTRCNLDKTCEYLQLDLASCFSRIETETAYLYGKRLSLKNHDSYACERGHREGSLDHFLYKLALRKKVAFENKNIDNLQHLPAGRTVILATGLDCRFYDLLGIPAATITGYEACRPFSGQVILTSFKDTYTNGDFAYLASKNHRLYSLLFSRNGLTPHDLDCYTKHLYETERISFSNWTRRQACVPLMGRLFKGDLILGGTLSGMIDPFFLSGVIAAMVSGKIAADAVFDPSAATREFERYHRNFKIKQWLVKMSRSRMTPRWCQKGLIYLHVMLKDVGKI